MHCYECVVNGLDAVSDRATALEQTIVLGNAFSWFTMFVHRINLNTGTTLSYEHTYPPATTEIRIM
jgi:hypothetical protein